jgi:hypothetical protein
MQVPNSTKYLFSKKKVQNIFHSKKNSTKYLPLKKTAQNNICDSIILLALIVLATIDQLANPR